MIIDCHAHIWRRPEDLGLSAAAGLTTDESATSAAEDESAEAGRGEGRGPAGRAAGSAAWGPARRRIAADVSDFMEASQAADLTIVLGFASRHLGAEVPLEFLGQHVGLHGRRTVGIIGIDPTAGGWREKLAEAVEQWAFRGVTICPACQDMHPLDNRALALYELCVERELPLFVDVAAGWPPSAALGFARPDLLDGVLREFPALQMVVSGFGYPFVDETLVLVEKFPRVFTDTSHLAGRPLALWQATAKAHEAGLLGKVFFGSGFPFVWPRAALAAVFNQCSPQHVPREYLLPRAAVEELLYRDPLSVLGIPLPEGFVERSAEAEETVEAEGEES
jgi:hypothetical protein